MSLRLDVAGRRVLVVGCGTHTVGRLHELLAEGAVVDLEVAGDPSAGSSLDALPRVVSDLEQRRLIAVVPPGQDRGSYDVVLREDVSGLGAVGDSATAPADALQSAGVGEVVLVGGGPGAPGLLTVAGLAELRRADVVVYDRLAPLVWLREAPLSAELVDVSKTPRGRAASQEWINSVLVDRAMAGKHVVRFKGGDPFVFGRGGEEVQACTAADVPIRVIPGVSSATAAAALAGIPVTHRHLVQGFTVVSGHVPPSDPRSMLDWPALARSGTTLVVLMGVATLPDITRCLLDAGLSPTTPAATVSDAGLSSMRSVVATLATLATDVAAAALGAPAVTIIGDVAGLDLGVVPGVAT